MVKMTHQVCLTGDTGQQSMQQPLARSKFYQWNVLDITLRRGFKMHAVVAEQEARQVIMLQCHLEHLYILTYRRV